jgi:hypothetical protein
VLCARKSFVVNFSFAIMRNGRGKWERAGRLGPEPGATRYGLGLMGAARGWCQGQGLGLMGPDGRLGWGWCRRLGSWAAW